MSRTLVYRQNRLFKLDTDQLPARAKVSSVMNALYAALYEEFLGAQFSGKYGNMDLVTRMQAVNDFASQWLIDKGFT